MLKIETKSKSMIDKQKKRRVMRRLSLIDQAYSPILAQVSRKPTVRLNTSLVAVA